MLHDIEISFCSAGGVLFGVADYVPALMEHVRAYEIGLNFSENLTAVDGEHKRATFTRTSADGTKETVVREFDLIHVVPPEVPPDFLRSSPLADTAGRIDVDPASLRDRRYDNICALRDACNTTNAKTAAAARKQAPVLAHNLLVQLGKAQGTASYDGYGSCPLTVERGKIVLAELTYGGKLSPSFSPWLLEGTKPSRLAWHLKKDILPSLYWYGMLKGREWMAWPRTTQA